MTTKTMTQAAYARHRGISGARVSTMIKTGKIPPSCYSVVSGKRQIDPGKADKAMEQNQADHNDIAAESFLFVQ